MLVCFFIQNLIQNLSALTHANKGNTNGALQIVRTYTHTHTHTNKYEVMGLRGQWVQEELQEGEGEAMMKIQCTSQFQRRYAP